ncbi:MAG: LPKTxAVK-anchored surface protein [Streptococcus sp.]
MLKSEQSSSSTKADAKALPNTATVK